MDLLLNPIELISINKVLQGESKKSVISGILADFGNFFFQPVMATNIIENFTIFEIFWLF